MRYILRLTAIFSIILFAVLGIWFMSDHDDGDHSAVEEHLSVAAMDELMAEDLSYTIQLFLHQMKEELYYLKSVDWNEETIKEEMKEEIKDHDHVFGFAHYVNNKESMKIGEMKKNAIEQLSEEKEDGILLSDPYVYKGKKRMLVGVEDEKNLFLAEVDLSFIENFIKDVASLSDSNGHFFVGGEDVDISLSPEESESPYVKAEVPEVGWSLYVKSDEQKEEEVHFKEGEVIVKLNENIQKEKWATDRGFHILDDLNGMVIIRSKHYTTEELMNVLEEDPEVVHLEPHFMYTKQFQPSNQTNDRRRSFNNTPFKRLPIPNDEFYHPYQWNLNQIFAEEGWDITVGEEAVPIAIIDSGIDPMHMDLEEKIMNGYNAFENNGAYNDENGHGTHVAGIAAAITNNRDGVAGVSWNNPILAVKCLDKNAEGNSLSIAKGIIWAVDEGAKVINLSLGDSHDSRLMYEAIKYAYDNDVVIIAASGNDNVSTPMYPAAYDEVLAVGAVDVNRKRAFFSNYGNHLDVSAPGEHIPSTYMGDQYVVMSGTSMAAPHVAGLAGLIRSVNPRLTNKEVYHLIRKTSDDLGKRGYDPFYGHGEVNVENALKELISN